ncbi:MAG TPA: hypothetical protein VJP87_13990 [Candidatus Acidoferrales bacterium]|nr:hypothetical protein [Candidatus Acidoferrales bacterium]
MFSARCANPDCEAAFDFRQGHIFRFHIDHPVGSEPLNAHSVRHFWLCGECSRDYTLEFREGEAILVKCEPEMFCTVGPAPLMLPG